MATTEGSNGKSPPAIARPLPAFVDWIAAAIIAVAGAALAVGGTVLTFVADRELLEEGIESGRITVVVFERDLTRTEMLEFTLEVVSWTGIGLLVTGVGLVVFAIGYAIARHRAHREAPDGETAGSYRANAVLGAVATTVLSFLPFSPVLGGGVAGYLEGYDTGRSLGAGALSGILAMLPAIVIVAFVTVGIFAGLSDVGATELGIVATTTMLLVLLFVGAYGAGLGALGGFAGGRFADRSGTRATDQRSA
jgi:hypothetical protein